MARFTPFFSNAFFAAEDCHGSCPPRSDEKRELGSKLLVTKDGWFILELVSLFQAGQDKTHSIQVPSLSRPSIYHQVRESCLRRVLLQFPLSLSLSDHHNGPATESY